MKLCGFDVGLDQPFFLIAGPCVIESQQMAFDTAGQLKEITQALGIPFIYKSSFDKANRSSGTSFRGLGMEKGLDILAEVKKQIGVPVLTDIHAIDEIAPVAAVVDVLQTPAFLCRQTDFIEACGRSGKPVNIKKGQFLAPHDMVNVIAKARAAAKAAGLNEEPIARSFSMQRILCNCQVGKVQHQAGSVSSCLCWRVPRLRLAFLVCLWKHIRIRQWQCLMVRMPYLWDA